MSYNAALESMDPATRVFLAGLLLFLIIISIITYVITAFLLGRVFKKAGIPAWIAWVPFYNGWKMLEMGDQKGYWSVLMLVPIVNYAALVFHFIATYRIGIKFDKDGTFVLLAIFLPSVWLAWLAFDNSKWQDTAPALTTVKYD